MGHARAQLHDEAVPPGDLLTSYLMGMYALVVIDVAKTQVAHGHNSLIWLVELRQRSDILGESGVRRKNDPSVNFQSNRRDQIGNPNIVDLAYDPIFVRGEVKP